MSRAFVAISRSFTSNLMLMDSPALIALTAMGDLMRHAARNRCLAPAAALLALIFTGLSGCGGGGGGGGEVADAVFKNGKVVTVDGSFSVVQAFAIKSGRFVGLGSNDYVDGFVGSNTKVVDLGGRTVVPGLADAHMHHEG